MFLSATLEPNCILKTVFHEFKVLPIENRNNTTEEKSTYLYIAWYR